MARSFESRDSERRSRDQARTPAGVDRHPTSLLLQWQRAAGNRAVTGALQRQVFKPRPKDKHPEPKTPKPTPPPPRSKKRLDWQKMVVEPLRLALTLAKKGPRQFEAAAVIANRVGDAVAEFNTRALDEQRPENGTVFQLLRLVHSLYWELHAGPNKGKGTRLPYDSDFPGDLVDRATWIEDLLKKRVAAKPDDSHLLGAWQESFSGDAKKIVDKIKASGEPKTALDSKILINDLENLRNIAVLIRDSVKDDPGLQTHLLAVVALITEHVVTTEQNMTGPNDVDTVTSHLITAQDVAEQLSPALNKIH
jgi:hypothetical protein